MSGAPGEQPSEDLKTEYPSQYVEEVVLKDGTQLTVRPIMPSDAPLLQEAFLRLSPESVYLRFLQAFRQLPEKQAHSLANLDYRQRMAFVAEIQEEDGPHIVGVARYGVIKPGVAEAAVVVVDEYQSRGLGTVLLDRLVKYARSNSVRAFTATIHMTNAKIMGFVKRSGFPFTKKMSEPGVWDVRVSIEEADGQA